MVALLIAGVDKSGLLEHLNGGGRPFSYELVGQGQGRLQFSLFQSVSGGAAYRPALDDLFDLQDGSGGHIAQGRLTEIVETSEGDLDFGNVRQAVAAADCGEIPSQRLVQLVIPAGTTLKDAIGLVVAQLSTSDPAADITMAAMANGPALTADVPFDYVYASDVLDYLAKWSGWMIRLVNWTVRAIAPGSIVYGTILSPANANIVGPVTVTQSRRTQATRVFVRCGGSGQAPKRDTIVGDGATRVFPLRYPAATKPPQVYCAAADAYRNVGIYGVDTLFEWTYRASDNALVQLAEAPPGNPIAPIGAGVTYGTCDYTAQFPFTVMAQDLTSGFKRDAMKENAAITDYDAGVAYAASLLPSALEQPRTVHVETRVSQVAGTFYPGLLVPLDFPAHNISNSSNWMVTEGEVTEDEDAALLWRLTLVEGTTPTVSWLEDFPPASSGGAGLLVGSGGGSTTVVALGSPVYLGGSRDVAVTKNPAAWTPVVNYPPFVAPASFSGRVRGYAWARHGGVSCTLRLFCVTDNAAAATGAAIAATVPTEVLLSVSIVSGREYRLEVLSSVADEGVFGIGVLENV